MVVGVVKALAGQWGSAKAVWEGWTRRSWSTPWSTLPPTSSLVLGIRVGNKGDWAVLGKDKEAFWGLDPGVSNPVDIMGGQTKQDMGWESGVLAMVVSNNKAEFGLAKRRRDGQVQPKGPTLVSK